MSDILKYGSAIRLAQLASDPSGAENGVLYYNTTSNTIRQYVNGAFADVPPSALTLLGLALNQNNIVVGNGSNLSVAVDSSASGDVLVDSSTGLTIKTGVIVNAQISASANIALSKLAALTASKALQSDGSGVISASSVTSTELGYVSGVTSAIQTQLNATEKTANKGAANGYAPLDASSKVPYANLPSALMTFKGAWDASTNTPTLADGTGTTGDVYRASVAGTQDLGSGPQTWAIGDFAIYNGTIWQHSPAADGVSSVNGSAGAVTVNAINQLTGDVTAGPASQSQSKAATVAAIQGTTVSGTTGTGNVVFSASPTLTGTLTASAISASSTISASNFSGSSSGTNTGDQTITLTGDVTGSGTGSFAATIANLAVTNAKIANSTIDLTAKVTGTLPIANGGTNSATALSNNRVMKSSGSAIVEAAAITAARALISDANGIPTHSAVTATELGYVSGVTSSIQTQLNATPQSVTGDLNQTTYSGLVNNTANQTVTGLAFANGSVRSARIQLSIALTATANSYAIYELMAIQRDADWQMTQTFTGDSISGLNFSITTAGQVQASIGNIAGFSSAKIQFRAQVTSV